MAAVEKVLVVGGGLAGATVAAHLADAGVAVDIVEVKADVTALGSGISLQGNALRELKRLGVLDECVAVGYPFDNLVIRAPDPASTVVAELPESRSGGPDVPAGLGMYRPDLARILTDRATAAGAALRLGTTVQALAHDDDGVDVTLDDGTTGRYDLVIGADGLRSATRAMLGIELETRTLGMGIWRVVAPRPAEVTSTQAVYGGPLYIAGCTPTSDDSLYAFLVEEGQERSRLSAQEQVTAVREVLAPYHGPFDAIRESVTDASRINYTWFETHLLESPWHRGRVVLIGETTHTGPPTLAQGGAMALEDARVLAETLLGADALTDSLLTGFAERRLPRVRELLEGSLQLAQWQIDHVQGDVPGLMGRMAQVASQEP